ncbi:MAG TPA: STING domain-containing protein [Verrucomicrobiae bacterium]|nr:STING domain-containing protein [Verrucomicrobiae bacterium]
MNKSRRLDWAGNILVVALWAATLYAVLAKLLKWRLPFDLDPDALSALLGLISTAVTALVAWFSDLLRTRTEQLEEEQYSTPVALAYGYVNNFIEPLITRLLQQAGPHAEDVRLHVFIPDELADLEPAAVERTVARMHAKQFDTKVINLQLDQGRPRDVLTVMGSGGKTMYFDFPNTLLTLKTVVDYKVHKAGRHDLDPDQARRELGGRFIQRFRQSVEEMLAQKKLGDYVKLTDKNLDFLGASPG